jgi:hypothetical protein
MRRSRQATPSPQCAILLMSALTVGARWQENQCGLKTTPSQLGDARDALGSYPILVQRFLESPPRRLRTLSTSTNALSFLAYRCKRRASCPSPSFPHQSQHQSSSYGGGRHKEKPVPVESGLRLARRNRRKLLARHGVRKLSEERSQAYARAGIQSIRTALLEAIQNTQQKRRALAVSPCGRPEACATERHRAARYTGLVSRILSLRLALIPYRVSGQSCERVV